MLDLASAPVAANRDHIEAHRRLLRDSVAMIAVREHRRRPPNPILLAIIDGELGRPEAVAHARLHFHEHDGIAILHDDIDLGARGAKIPRDDPIASPLEVARRAMLATLTVLQATAGAGNRIANPEPQVIQ